MTSSNSKCNRTVIDAFLNGDTELDAGLSEHLESCADCREYLESQAAPPNEWHSIAKYLQVGEFDEATMDAFSIAASSVSVMPQPVKANDVLTLLDPSDTPNSLGRIGPYEVSEVIGIGGMGVVLKAFDPTLDRTVAIKVLAPRLAASQDARRRFSREAKAVAAVDHRNVIAIHSVAHEEMIPYLVMAYVPGGSLQQRIQSQGALSAAEIVRIGYQVSSGLAAAHAMGLVHRDIKPANILLSESNEATLTDFGLARAADDISLTHTGAIAGTPQYMSPEQARGESVDQRSDLFSLGSVLYAMSTGKAPFHADNTYGMIRAICDDQPDAIRSINPKVPDWLAHIVERMMDKDPQHRFESAEQVEAILKRCLAHLQSPETVELPIEIATVRSSSRKRSNPFFSRGLLATVAVSSIGIALLFGWNVLSEPKPTNPNLTKQEHISETDLSANGTLVTPKRIALGDPAPALSGLTDVIGNSLEEIVPGTVHVFSFCDSQHPRLISTLQGLSAIQQQNPNLKVQSCIYKVNEDGSFMPTTNEGIAALLTRLQLKQSVAFCSSDISEKWQAGFESDPPVTFVVDEAGRLIWRGTHDRVGDTLSKLESKTFSLETESRNIVREEAMVSEFRAAVSAGDWDRATNLFGNVSKVAPVVAGDFAFMRFKLRINDNEEIEAALKIARQISDNYPDQPELLRETAARVNARIYKEIFRTGETPTDWIATARSLATSSVKQTSRQNAQSLATLAETFDCEGDLNTSIGLIKEAIQVAEDSNLEQLDSTLAGWVDALSASK